MIKGVSSTRRPESKYSLRVCHAHDDFETIYFDSKAHFEVWWKENPNWKAADKCLVELE